MPHESRQIKQATQVIMILSVSLDGAASDLNIWNEPGSVPLWQRRPQTVRENGVIKLPDRVSEHPISGVGEILGESPASDHRFLGHARGPFRRVGLFTAALNKFSFVHSVDATSASYVTQLRILLRGHRAA